MFCQNKIAQVGFNKPTICVFYFLLKNNNNNLQMLRYLAFNAFHKHIDF